MSEEIGSVDLPESLSAAEQNLVERYADGELGWFGRMRAQSLLRRSSGASDYLKRLSALNSTLTVLQDTELEGVDFNNGKLSWEALEMRLEQEERSQLFLGERKVLGSQSWGSQSWWSEFFSFDRLAPFGVGAGSALALSSMLLFVFVGGNPLLTRQGASQGIGEMASSNGAIGKNDVNWAITNTSSGMMPLELVSSRVQPVTHEIPMSSFVSTQPRVAATAVPVARTSVVRNQRALRRMPVEVDWVRSDGRIRIMHSPNSSAPILWVRKRVPNAKVVRSAPVVTTAGGNSQGIVVKEPNIPTANFADH